MRSRALFLHDLPAREEARFKRELSSSGGRLLVVVHPFYHEDDPLWKDFRTGGLRKLNEYAHVKMKETAAQYLSGLGRLLRSRVPLAVFEEQHRVRDTNKRFKHFRKTNALFIPTINGNIHPMNERTSKTAERLATLGARNVFVAGQIDGKCVRNLVSVLKDSKRFDRVQKLPKITW